MSKKSDDLQGKVIVITGASSGFGKGSALAFAEAGAKLVLAARRDELLDELVAECQAKGGQAVALTTDVSIEAEVEALAQAALTVFDRIDVWINNAGVASVGPFEEIPLADHAQVIRTNLIGTIAGSHCALKQFRTQGRGTIINIASAVGKIPAPYYSSYVASKFGVVGLSDALRQEIAQRKLNNIHVCTVMPMAMDTPFFEHAGHYGGPEAQPIPPLYDAQKVIDTIVRMATRPQDEQIVGGVGSLMNVLHHVAPALVEKAMGLETHQVQMEQAGTAPDSSGSVHHPVPTGRGVKGDKTGK